MKKGIVVGAIVTVFAAAVAVIARIAMMRNVEAEQESTKVSPLSVS